MWPPDEQRFTDRSAAGRELAQHVATYLAQLPPTHDEAPGPLVLGLPRGGVPVGFEVAKAVNGEFDIVIARKIGLPWQPEFGVGAIAEDGPPVFDRDALASAGMTAGELMPAVQRERVELRRRQERYRDNRPAPAIAGRVVVVVDDGLATGMTSRAALRALRAADPAHLVFAAPVCAAEAADWLVGEADAVLHVHSPREFHALGMWYRDFTPVTDTRVSEIMSMARTATTVA